MAHEKVAVTLAACIGWLVLSLFKFRNKKHPPGPRDLVYLEAFGQPLILLNSSKVGKDLLEQRSAIYSDRPHLVSELNQLFSPLIGNYVRYDKGFVLQSYNDNWRQQRKIVTQDLAPRMLPRYHAFQEAEARLLAKNVIEDPSKLEHLIKLRIGTIIIRITYGHYISTDNDPFLTGGRAAMDIFSRSAEPGVWLWLPGSGFLATAKSWREIVHKAAWDPYLWAKHSLESGTALLPNTCATALEAVGGTPSSTLEEQLVWAACMMMEGGMDTSMISALNFFLEMMLNPTVQRKAQEEIDSVIGRDRLPTIADKASLPYVRSVVTEVFRLNPAIPLGVPHALSKDDVYQDMHLPKGSIVIPNVWHMLHDPDVFPDPMKFNPERYKNLDSEMEKVTDLVFGFGRRLCPGKSFGEANVFAIAATVLATCDIRPTVDEKGQDIIPDVNYSSGSISFPSRFDCNIKPRSHQVYELLSHSVVEIPDSSLVH
ncbi:putative monooxygenase [Mycena rebaudengoi]|nr:putative monooxygenase [Mycena rebaudengoi]